MGGPLTGEQRPKTVHDLASQVGGHQDDLGHRGPHKKYLLQYLKCYLARRDSAHFWMGQDDELLFGIIFIILKYRKLSTMYVTQCRGSFFILCLSPFGGLSHRLETSNSSSVAWELYI